MIVELKKEEERLIQNGNAVEKKNLNERIEDLVIAMEQVENVITSRFSFKSAFYRGLLQGLGIIIGSTILAGLSYSVATKFVDKTVIKSMTLEYILRSENIK